MQTIENELCVDNTTINLNLFWSVMQTMKQNGTTVFNQYVKYNFHHHQLYIPDIISPPPLPQKYGDFEDKLKTQSFSYWKLLQMLRLHKTID